jgi:hypothetical protein
MCKFYIHAVVGVIMESNSTLLTFFVLFFVGCNFELLVKYYLSGKIKKVEIGGAAGTVGENA